MFYLQTFFSISFDNISIYKMSRELCKQIVYAIDEKKKSEKKNVRRFIHCSWACFIIHQIHMKCLNIYERKFTELFTRLTLYL